MRRLKMALYLQRDMDVREALTTFNEFVKGSGGNRETLNNYLDFFYQWRDSLNPGEVGVLFLYGPYGVMAAYAVNAVTARYRQLIKQA